MLSCMIAEFLQVNDILPGMQARISLLLNRLRVIIRQLDNNNNILHLNQFKDIKIYYYSAVHLKNKRCRTKVRR
jgi:hypothetical protein